MSTAGARLRCCDGDGERIENRALGRGDRRRQRLQRERKAEKSAIMRARGELRLPLTTELGPVRTKLLPAAM